MHDMTTNAIQCRHETYYQNPDNECKSLNTVVLLLPICLIISFCRLIGCSANWARRWPSSTPRTRGLFMISFRTDLSLVSHLIIEREEGGHTGKHEDSNLLCAEHSWLIVLKLIVIAWNGLVWQLPESISFHPHGLLISCPLDKGNWVNEEGRTIEDLGLRRNLLFGRFATCYSLTCHHRCSTIVLCT
jgi:hypothetical protein